MTRPTTTATPTTTVDLDAWLAGDIDYPCQLHHNGRRCDRRAVAYASTWPYPGCATPRATVWVCWVTYADLTCSDGVIGCDEPTMHPMRVTWVERIR